MITDNDIKKLKTVFATKEELRALDLKMATKQDLQKSTNQLIELITVGFDRIDKAIEKLDEHTDVINNHEHRLDRLGDKVFV